MQEFFPEFFRLFFPDWAARFDFSRVEFWRSWPPYPVSAPALKQPVVELDATDTVTGSLLIIADQSLFSIASGTAWRGG